VVGGLALPLDRLGEVDSGVILAISEALGGAHAEASGDPEVAEDAAGVEDGHGSSGGDDEGTLEDHEGKLVVGEVGVEAAPELGDTVDTADEDEDSGDEQACGTLAIARRKLEWEDLLHWKKEKAGEARRWAYSGG